ncbi:MAG TPA: tetratricopeptide repeat protein [Chlamydiales bacterium]|nr:tetratricopeptide repeat protein [Chlamydiales bacterium]
MRPYHALFLLLTSCAITPTGQQLAQGNQLVSFGDYAESIPFLEKAVELSPDNSKAHASLSNAHLLNHNLEKAWIHARISLSCPTPDQEAFTNFLNLFETLDMKYHFTKGNLHEDEILGILGKPDNVENQGVQQIWTYGIAKFTFSNKSLISSECSLLNNQRAKDLFHY